MKKLLCAAAALLALSCFFDEPTEPGPEAPPLTTSPANVLKCVELSFNQRDVAIIDGVLTKAFVFYFDPDDVGQSPPGGNYEIPESWSYTQFRVAVGNMLEKAHSVSLTIPTGGVGTPDPHATTYRAEGISIKILVMIDELNGYIANQGYCNFEFERYENEKGYKLWRLTRWEDNTAMYYDANPGVTPGSFGKILALFYQ